MTNFEKPALARQLLTTMCIIGVQIITAVGVSQQILVMLMEAGATMQMDVMLVLFFETTGA